MRDYAKISPKFWIGRTGKQIRALGVEAQLTAIYLLTSPQANMLGLYYLPLTYIAHETGQPLEGASKALRRLCKVEFCAYDEDAEVVWVYEMARYQLGDSLKSTDKQAKGVSNHYESAPSCVFLGAFFDKYAAAYHLTNRREDGALSKPLASPLQAPSKQEQEQETEQEKREEKEQDLFAPSATPSTPKAPPVISIPLVDKTDYDIDAEQVAAWSGSFPGIDVLQELRKAREWSLSNPTKRKTAKGIRRHLTAWLSSAQDKGGGHPSQRSQPANVGYHPGSPASEFVTGIVKL